MLLTRQAQEYVVNNLETILGDEASDNQEDIVLPTDYSMQGQHWSKEEENRLIDEFSVKELSISEIAKIHNRSYGGIRARLKKLRLIE